MHSLTDQQYKDLCRVLSGIYLGNLGYRLKISDEDEDYDTLATHINLIGQIAHHYFTTILSEKNKLSHVKKIELTLDDKYRVKSIGHYLPQLIGEAPRKIAGSPFEELIAPEAQSNWLAVKNHFQSFENMNYNTVLSFKINSSLHYTVLLYFRKLPDNHLHVSTIEEKPVGIEKTNAAPIVDAIVETSIKEYPVAQFHKRKLQNQDLARKVLHYLQGHLDSSLPHMNTLTKKFGVNEKKLKEAFKKFYHKTPNAYLADLKLDRAMKLLQTTRMSIEEVAFAIGYTAKSGFYKAFKKKYGITPGEVQLEN